jgi:hypothetical protein
MKLELTLEAMPHNKPIFTIRTSDSISAWSRPIGFILIGKPTAEEIPITSLFWFTVISLYCFNVLSLGIFAKKYVN